MEIQGFAIGHWPSPISAASAAQGARRLGRVQIVDGAVYWSESRPAENGRSTVMRWSREGGVTELSPAPYSARSRVHEYGGGEFLVADGRLFFVNGSDQNVYETRLSEAEVPASMRRLTDLPATRFGDFTWDRARQRLIGIGETHNADGKELPENQLWSIPADPSGSDAGPKILLGGHDFFASPRLSPDGRLLAYLAWDLPTMPWDAAKLYIAEIREGGEAGEPHPVAGGDGNPCFQPEWSADGALYFVWDVGGFSNLFQWQRKEGTRQVTDLNAELAIPLWSLNATSYALLSSDKAYCTYVRNGVAGSVVADLRSGAVQAYDHGLSAIQSVTGGTGAVALAGTSDFMPLHLAMFEVGSGAQTSPAIIRHNGGLEIDPDYISVPSRIEIPTAGGVVHGLLYQPKNPLAECEAGNPPPLIVSLHGGPTGAASRGLKLRTLFFTSRGFAWLDLDYAGSTGYGRAYRERLKGNWGVADVEDTVSAARYAASSGLADADAIFVTGGSAGGYTVLMAIAEAHVFRGAASYYGICDLIQLQKTTHKFEYGYQSTLLGGALEQNEEVYRQRSPINHAGKITTPLILFQGTNDQVVPKEQSIAIASALRAKGVPIEYHEFAGEDHGFRQAETIRSCLESELAFYQMLMTKEGSL